MQKEGKSERQEVQILREYPGTEEKVPVRLTFLGEYEVNE